MPVYSYDSFSDFEKNIPYNCKLIGVELTSQACLLEKFKHPQRACYILGAEDDGLSAEAQSRCEFIICLRGIHSMNVAVAGSIVLYHRTMTFDPDLTEFITRKKAVKNEKIS